MCPPARSPRVRRPGSHPAGNGPESGRTPNMPKMKVVPEKTLVLVAGRGHHELAEEVCDHLQSPLSEVVLSTFANGEIYCRYGESIRGTDVFVFQSHCDPINDRLM